MTVKTAIQFLCDCDCLMFRVQNSMYRAMNAAAKMATLTQRGTVSAKTGKPAMHMKNSRQAAVSTFGFCVSGKSISGQGLNGERTLFGLNLCSMLKFW
ncbi:hypothetical protein RP726_10955 [Candidatus Methylospira mobilis]|uniref:hypothetical protein n=1 Tax=Candidatus Methylospira mobilis TaxID=1808979 RepID=UPI0018856466|nr:hypothetical protein [Candidatus Methylospira mobilis]WNV02992.1 hypothetical protein RP726_10955 [Candidatus Methylospira mobilis]